MTCEVIKKERNGHEVSGQLPLRPTFPRDAPLWGLHKLWYTFDCLHHHLNVTHTTRLSSQKTGDTSVFGVEQKRVRDEKHKIRWAVNPPHPTPRWSRVGSYNDSCKSSLYANPKKTWRARCASVDVLTNHRGKNTIMPWRRDKQQVKVFSPLHPNPPPSSLNHWQQRASEQTATLFPREIPHGYHRNHVPLLNRRVLRRESRSFASLIAKKYKIHADSLLAKQNNNIFPFYCKTPVSARYYISYQDS